MKEKHKMQYTLRCRDVKNRVGALEVHVKILRRIQRRREKNVIMRCRVKTASAQSIFWQARRTEKETKSGTRN